MKKLGNGANVGLTSGVLSTLGMTSLRRGSAAAAAAAAVSSASSPSAGVRSGGASALYGGQPGAVARQAAERVADERDRLYTELKV